MQDFVNYKTDFLVKPPVVSSLKVWSLDISSMVVGFILGGFACLLYLDPARVRPVNTIEDKAPAPAAVESVEDSILKFEFFQELKTYEVEPKYPAQ